MFAQFLRENASAVFGLIGALGGAVLSFSAAWFLKRRELQLRLYEKVTDRRLASHDSVIALAKELRKTGIPYDETSDVQQRAPICLCTIDTLDEFNTNFALTMVEHTTWLSADLVRELHLFQDYLGNVQLKLREIGKDKTFELGCIIREDFIDFSSRIERLAFHYFASIGRLEKLKPPANPQYSDAERQARLEQTALVRRYGEIETLRRMDRPTP